MELFERYESWGFPQNASITLPQVFRVNTLKTTVEECVAYLRNLDFDVQPTTLPDAFTITGSVNPAVSLPHLAGWIYFQELSSQYVVRSLGFVPEQVIDIAAAPGSKTTHMAAIMKNKGRIVALDTSHDRLISLQSNCSRLGVSNVVCYQIDGSFADSIVRDVDAVICDVPCSGNFTQSHWNRTLEDVQSRISTQQKLLQSAVLAAKQGGIVLYSTCSLEKEENEEVVEWALEHLPVKLTPIEFSFGHPGLSEKTSLCRRLWPTQDGVGGFFIARLEVL